MDAKENIMKEQERLARRMFGEPEYTPSVWDQANNPLFMKWKDSHVDIFSGMDSPRLGKCLSEFRARDESIHQYGFAIPTEKVLRKISKLSASGVIEIGAGTGYWAKLLRVLGVDVLACDDSSGHFGFKVGSCSQVDPVSYKDLFKKPEVHKRTLLVVWPDGDNLEIFNLYRGDTVVYVGELGEGATGYDGKIEETWKMVQHMKIPVWSGIHDSVGIFKRKGL